MHICLPFGLATTLTPTLPIPVVPNITTHLFHFKEDLPTIKLTFSPCYLNLFMVPVLARLPNTLHWPAFIPSRQSCPKVPLSQLPRDSSCYCPPWGDSPGKSFYVFSLSYWTLLMIHTQEPQGSTGGHSIPTVLLPTQLCRAQLELSEHGKKTILPVIRQKKHAKIINLYLLCRAYSCLIREAWL